MQLGLPDSHPMRALLCRVACHASTSWHRMGLHHQSTAERTRREVIPEPDGVAVQVTVLRDGRTQEISTFDLLVGDVLLVDTGDILAADGMLAQGNDLR